MRRRKLILVVVVVLVAIVVVSINGGRSAMRGGWLHRFLVANGIRNEGTYEGKRILRFNGYHFTTEDWTNYYVEKDGAVQIDFWSITIVNGQPWSGIEGDEAETSAPVGANANPYPTPVYEDVKP